MAIVGINVEVFMAGVRVASDMLFCTLTLFVLYWLVVVGKRLKEGQFKIRDPFVLGIAFGLTYDTRYPALLLIPSIVCILMYLRNARVKAWATLVFAFVIVVSPQLWVNYLSFGDPFYSENWRNMAVHYFGLQGHEWNDFYLTYPKDEFIRQLLNNPLTIPRRTLTTAIRFTAFDLPNTLNQFTVGLFIILFAFLSYLRKRREFFEMAIWLYVPINIIGLAAVFEISPRMVLPLLSLLYVAALGYLANCSISNLKLLKPALVLGLCVASFIIGFMDIQKYAYAHSLDDLDALRWVERNYGEGKIFGTSVFLGNHTDLDYRYFDWNPYQKPKGDSPDSESLAEKAVKRGYEYLGGRIFPEPMPSLPVVAQEEFWRALLDRVIRERDDFVIIGARLTGEDSLGECMVSVSGSQCLILQDKIQVGHARVYRIDKTNVMEHVGF